MSIPKRLSWLVCALALLVTHARPALASPARQAEGEAAAQAAAMLERVNQARRDAGLLPYVVNPALTRAAQGHAEEIATFENFSHTSRDGRKAKDRVIEQGYAAGREGLRVGENFVGRAEVEEAFAWLMEDPPHRENILDPDYREIGIGVGEIRWGYIWVMDLATYQGIDAVLAAPPSPTTPPPSATLPPSATASPPAATETPESASPTQPPRTRPPSPDPAATETPGAGVALPSATVTLAPVSTLVPEPVRIEGPRLPGVETGDRGSAWDGLSPGVQLALGALLLAALIGAGYLAGSKLR